PPTPGRGSVAPQCKIRLNAKFSIHLHPLQLNHLYIITNMSDSYKNVESRVTQAFKTIHNDLTSNISCYSYNFHVSYYHLYHCHQNCNSHSTQSSTNQKLTEVQKTAVIDHMT